MGRVRKKIMLARPLLIIRDEYKFHMKYFRYFETKAEMDNFDSELPNWLIANKETKGAQLKIKVVGVENIQVLTDPIL